MTTNSSENLKKKRKRSALSAKPNDEILDVDYIIQDDVEKIRVGSNYQANIPELLSHPENKKNKQRPKSLLVWFPPKNISEVELNNYILFSKKKYGYDTEQCLGLLYWNKHDLEKSIHDLPNFSPLSNWSVLDKSNFEFAFDKIGKDFVHIKKMLPGKSLKSVICYYYLWKKKKTEHWSVQPANKLEQFCANEIQNESSEESSSSKCEPDNKTQHDNQDIGHVHKKLNATNYRNSALWNNGGVLHAFQDKIKTC